ncbi:hypothetical protein [Acinetobacter seifertii]|uniref:hypothetical protein n=1 Tax=Acinetobacter seifertii TaxID=1530123 RepID=UPI00124F9291|nr:hypothetical protein [Acinetobacter seifertii]
MSDEASFTESSIQNNFTGNILQLFRIFIILRNLSYNLKTSIPIDGLESSKLYAEFEMTAIRISDFPLFYSPKSELNQTVKNLYSDIKEIINPYNSVFNNNVFNHTDNINTSWRITKEINNIYISNKSNFKNTQQSNDLYFKIKPQFDSIKSTFDSFLDSIKVKQEISEINNKLEEVKLKSSELDDLIKKFEDSNASFKVFEEKQLNEKTKAVYTEIYNSEYKLANYYRRYTIGVFSVIALIAGFNFILPTVLGLISYRNGNGFLVPSVDIFFFIKTVFMLLLTAPGWYFAKESAKHRQVAYKAKIISSELTALPYYLADLEVKDRHEMRMKMADKFFGQELYNDKKSDSSNVSEQTKATTEAIKTINALLIKSSKMSDTQ